MMKAYIFLLTFFVFLSPGYLYAGDKVYSDDDLDQYRSGNEDEAYRYNQKVLQNNQNKSDQYDTQNKVNEILDSYNRNAEEQNIKKSKAMKRIGELEEEKAKAKTERDFIGGYVAKRNAEERGKRAVQREVEIDSAYREAGLSRERELQKRTEAAEKRARDAEMDAEGPRDYWDSDTGRRVHCVGGFCH
jgi:hypothetical protein